ncbi:MAG: ABC transporter substrate-binding protein, partial [Pseudomonadota bacterium]|nr:ABC transporter substrate-binding protein [Pseudomonadota bacterium]
MIRSLLMGAACALSLTTAALAEDQSYPDADAIVSVGGPVTEILFALDAGERVIARDTTSMFPAEAMALPDVGYMRRLSPEGVLSVGPDLIIARHTSGPVETLDLLRAASVPVVLVRDGFSGEAVSAAIRTVGTAIGAEDKAEALAGEVEADLAALAGETAKVGHKKRVMFILSNDGGRLNVAGRNTGADGIITLAGATNVMAESYEGYKLVNDEAIIEAQPDLVLMMSGRGDHA